MTESLNVTVRNKTNVFLKADCLSISMSNTVGPFDILPEHANFISLIAGEVVAREVSGKTWKKEGVRGVVRVVSNVVDVVILE